MGAVVFVASSTLGGSWLILSIRMTRRAFYASMFTDERELTLSVMIKREPLETILSMTVTTG
jgi:hypothetical protein